ncbi:MAG: tRNA pseudouridine(55) synthase TruB [Candidatus Gastranaerophilales bacterium]|nr:tRNA pseudouridine(55) synthase TruB [Candidatus Gastranaerophilales bacterium]
MKFFGIINVNKHKGLTSHDVVSKLRKILNMKQIGHTGTLDPMATGVLPVAIGKATKLIQYMEGSKSYRAFIKLGVRTDTYDLEGQILETNPVIINMEKIKSVLGEFQGDITQIPPMYSAVHYKGKRLYEYARANIEIENIPERQINISSIELAQILEENSENPILIVDIDCSAGTYIRSIANDLGDKLGYGATLHDLIRTKSGKLNLDTSHTLDEIEEFRKSEKINDLIINPICILNLECCKIEQNNLEKIQKGQSIENIELNGLNEEEKIQLVYEDKLVAIAKIKDKIIFPVNVFI